MEELVQLLDIEEEDPIIRCIFGATANAVPGVTLLEIVSAMEMQPNRPTFITACTKGLTSSQRNIALVFPTIIAFIVAAALLIVNFTDDSPYGTTMNLLFPITDQWRNGCPNGPTRSCMFVNKDLKSIHNLADARHYLSSELVRELWGWLPNDGVKAASDTLWGGVWLVGALLLQSSPSTHYHPPKNPEHTLIPCRNLNLTTNFVEPFIPEEFMCSAWTATTIPFSLSLNEALERAASFNPVRQEVDTVWMAQFGGVSPTTGVLLWTTITVTVPIGGDMLTRAHVIPIDLETKNKLFPLLLLQVVVMVISLLIMIYNSYLAHRGILFVFFNRSVMIETPLLCILIAAFVQFSQLPEVKDLAQVDFVPANFDAIASKYRSGVVFLGIWVMTWVMSTLRFFKDLNGVGLIIRLLRVVALEVLGLFFVFGVIYLGFLCAAVALFGATQYQFSSAMHANSELLPFWWEEESMGVYNLLTQESPIAGGIYFYVYKSFVFFFALDLLIAVVTSPLHSVKKAATLHTEVAAHVTRILTKSSLGEQIRFKLRKIAIPIVGFVIDALVFLPITSCWVRFHYMLETVYAYEKRPSLRSRMKHCLELLKFVQEAQDPEKCVPYTTPLWKGTIQHDIFKDDVEREIVKACLIKSSASALVRDARLLSILRAYGQFNAELDEVMKVMNHTREENAHREHKIAERIEEALNEGVRVAATSPERGSASVPSVGSPMAHSPTSSGAEHTSHGCLGEPEKTVAVAKARRTRNDSRLEKAFGSVNRTFRKKRQDADGPRVSELTFAFSQYFMRRLDSRRFFPCYLILVAVAYIILISSLLLSEQEVAWVSANAKAGLVHEPYETTCDDPQCRSAFTINKDFHKQGHLRDFFQYVNRSLRPYLFPSYSAMTGIWGANFSEEVDGFSNAWSETNFTVGLDGFPEFEVGSEGGEAEELSPVYWDLELFRKGPIIVRQLRAKQIPCAIGGADSGFFAGASPERVKLMTSFPCFGTGAPKHLTSEPMVRPDDSPYPPSAYVWREGCAQPGNVPMRGWFHIYACAGYTVNITTREELAYLRNWIDNTTRFISITLGFQVEGEEELVEEQHLFWELAHQGGSAWVWTRAYPEGHQTLNKWNPCAYAVMALEFLLFLIGFVRCLYFRWVGNIIKAEHTKPDAPLSVMLAGLMMLGATLFADSTFDRDTFFTLVCVAFLTVRFLFSVAFPLADLLTRGASLIKNILWLTLSNITIIIPFYVVAFVALVLSGNVMFCERLLTFANLKTAAITVGRGLVGQWDFEEFGQFNSSRAGLVYSCVFIVVVLILLFNIVLSLVHGSAEGAREEEEALEFIATTSAALKKHIVSGPIFQFMLSHIVGKSWLWKCIPSAWLKPSSQPFTITGKGRFPLPWEVLYWMPEFGSRLHAELITYLDAYNLPGSLTQSTVMLIAKEMREFEQFFTDRRIDDEALEFRLRLEDEKIADELLSHTQHHA